MRAICVAERSALEKRRPAEPAQDCRQVPRISAPKRRQDASSFVVSDASYNHSDIFRLRLFRRFRRDDEIRFERKMRPAE